MKHLITIMMIALLSSTAFGQAKKQFKNRAVDQDTELCATPSGGESCPVVVDGPTGNIKMTGISDGSSAAAGEIGERIDGVDVGGSLTTTVPANFSSLTLTPGVWMLYFRPVAANSGAVTSTETSISTANAGHATATKTRTGALPQDIYLSSTAYVNISVSDIYYGVLTANFPSGSVTRSSATEFYAIRIR